MSPEFKEQFSSLIADTLSFIKENYPLPPKKEKKAPPIPQPKKKEEEEVIIAPQPAPIKNEPLFSLIGKHLPHFHLKTEPQGVAICVFNKENLPFLKNLANAIVTHLCPVEIIQEGWEKTFQEKSFQLILSDKKELPQSRDNTEILLLLPAETYEKNSDAKKQLWAALCQRLKPKSPKSS